MKHTRRIVCSLLLLLSGMLLVFRPSAGQGSNPDIGSEGIVLKPGLLLKGHRPSLSQLAFSPDGKYLAAAGAEDQLVMVWESQTGTLEATLHGHQDVVNAITFTPNGKTLISLGADSAALLWDMPQGKLRKRLNTGLPDSILNDLALSPDGHLLATGGGGESVRLWNLPDGTLRKTFPVGHMGVTSLAFSPDGKWLASAGPDGIVRVWNTTSGQRLYARDLNVKSIRQVVFSPDGKLLASIAGNDDTVQLWDSQTGTLSKPLQGQNNHITQIAFTPDGTTLVGSGIGAPVVTWEVSSGQLMRTFPTTEGAFGISPDGALLVAESKTYLGGLLLDMKTGKELARLPGAEIDLSTFSPDGKTLATGSRDGATVALWTLRPL